MSVSTADLKKRVETDLDTITLQRILDAAVKAVTRSAGNATTEQEDQDGTNSDWLVLHRRHSSITSIKERRRHSSDQVTLAADDYRVVGDYRILRLRDGTNPASFWGQHVEIIYVPEVDAALRDRVALDLAQCDIEFRAYDEESTGNWKGKADWKRQRKQLLAQVREGRSPFV